MISINFENHTDTNIDLEIFESVLEKVEKFGLTENVSGTISLTLLSNKEIKNINNQYRKINKPTDVLSFSYLEEEKFPIEKDLIGEILISPDYAQKNLAEKIHPENTSLIQELEYLFLHGILHIFGFKHDTDDELNDMLKLQDRILDR